MYGYRLQISNQSSSGDRVDKSEHKMYTVRHMSVMGASDFVKKYPLKKPPLLPGVRRFWGSVGTELDNVRGGSVPRGGGSWKSADDKCTDCASLQTRKIL